MISRFGSVVMDILFSFSRNNIKSNKKPQIHNTKRARGEFKRSGLQYKGKNIIVECHLYGSSFLHPFNCKRTPDIGSTTVLLGLRTFYALILLSHQIWNQV